MIVGHTDNLRSRHAETIAETDMTHGNNGGPAVDQCPVAINPEAIVFCRHEYNVGSPGTLSHPDVAHCGELKFPQHDAITFAKRECAGDAVHPGRGARYQCDFVGVRPDQAGEDASGSLVMLDPQIPRRTMIVPSLQVM